MFVFNISQPDIKKQSEPLINTDDYDDHDKKPRSWNKVSWKSFNHKYQWFRQWQLKFLSLLSLRTSVQIFYELIGLIPYSSDVKYRFIRFLF